MRGGSDLLEFPVPCCLGFFSKGFEEAARWQVLYLTHPHLEPPQGDVSPSPSTGKEEAAHLHLGVTSREKEHA